MLASDEMKIVFPSGVADKELGVPVTVMRRKIVPVAILAIANCELAKGLPIMKAISVGPTTVSGGEVSSEVLTALRQNPTGRPFLGRFPESHKFGPSGRHALSFGQ